MNKRTGIGENRRTDRDTRKPGRAEHIAECKGGQRESVEKLETEGQTVNCYLFEEDKTKSLSPGGA